MNRKDNEMIGMREKVLSSESICFALYFAVGELTSIRMSCGAGG